MSEHQGPFDTNQGIPNLGALQYYQDNWNATQIAASLQVAKLAVTATAVAGLSVTIPEGAKILDVIVIATATNGSGSMTVKTGADTPSSITDAITCDTDKEVNRAGTIDDAYNVVTSDGVKVFSNGADDRGIVHILYMK